MTEPNALRRLADHGQSFWMDSLDRGMIHSGALADLVREDGLRGITSNPAIFLKAIAGGEEYEEQIRELVDRGLSVEEIYEAIVVRDVQDACDVLAPVFEETEGGDGFVSLEVSPYVAHDAGATLEEARRLHAAVDRPNVYIKIPGTAAGLAAIEEALFSGINVNVTLLFSVDRYREVAEAYVRALERRVQAGLPVDGVSSVASFFLSRIDVLADELLSHRITGREHAGRSRSGDLPQHLLGRAAIANARVAHQVFEDVFSGDRWRQLTARGARVQRLLWASTGSKNPLYDELRYVEPLIGPQTVNTMPHETAEAFRARGSVADTLEASGPEGPRRVLTRLADVGVHIERVTDRLEDEAVRKFITPFDDLMGTLAAERSRLLRDRDAVVVEELAAEKGELEDLLDALQEQRVPRRMFDGDASLWLTPGAGEEGASPSMGWLTSLDEFAERAGEIRTFAEEVRRDGLSDVLVLGMGGSSLTADVCARMFGAAQGEGAAPGGGLRLTVLDDTDPAAVLAVERALDLPRTLVVVASKSGTTLETLCLYRHFLRRMEDQGVEDPAGRFVAITDPGTPLSAEANRLGIRRVFENPSDIGGRYSALSYFGLVPMALLGVDIRVVLSAALRMRTACGPLVPAARNPAVRLGALLAGAARRGRDKATFDIPGPLAPFAAWIEQLLAESTGKRGRGVVPVVGEPPAGPEAYADDRVFVQMRLSNESDAASRELEARMRDLAEAGHPVVRIEPRSLEELGGEMLRWELAIAAAGVVLGIDPFDQPDVELTKQATAELLSRHGEDGAGRPSAGDDAEAPGHEEARASWAGRAEIGGSLAELLAGARPGDYLALLPYFRRDEERDAALAELRTRVREGTRLATTIGYGPRYLHSTGQLHKGGPNTGLFVVLTADEEEALDIPDTPYGFQELHRAQAEADFRTLTALGRRAVRIHLGRDVQGGLVELLEGARGAVAATAGRT